jgi:hypothetical protein
MWSACECVDIAEMAALETQARSWATVRRLSIDADAGERLHKLLDGPLHRSLRVLHTTSRAAMAQLAQWHRPLAIEELVLAFDVSNDPPTLAKVAALPKLHTIGVHCLPEFAPRWVERVAAARIPNIRLVMFPQLDNVREALRTARRLPIARLVLEIRPGFEITAARDADGMFTIRTIEFPITELFSRVIHDAKHWLGELAEFVDPGVKVALPVLDPELARQADAERIKLVAAASTYPARPKA